MNATLIVTWPSGLRLHYEANWIGQHVECPDALEEIYFSDTYAAEWKRGWPDIDVKCFSTAIRSRVTMCDEIGEFIANIDIDKVLT